MLVTAIVIGCLAGSLPSRADERGENAFREMKTLHSRSTVSACTLGKRQGVAIDPASQWDRNMVVIVENWRPHWFGTSLDRALGERVQMFFLDDDNQLRWFCGNGLIGLDEQCGTGNWTGQWSRCALKVLQAETTPIQISRVKRSNLLRMARRNYCGDMEMTFTRDDPGSDGRWYTCVVTPDDGRAPYSLEQQ